MKLETIALSPEKIIFLMDLFDTSEEEILAACNCKEVSDLPEVKKVENIEEIFSAMDQDHDCPTCLAYMRQFVNFIDDYVNLAFAYYNICNEASPDERILIIRRAAVLN